MKKLALVLTLALVLAFAAPVFANPFSDVPADHWAYDAISKLQADGVITGNPDGSFTGSKSLTRYEIAVIVAKAMAAAEANADKIAAEDQATIDKLAAEFGSELAALGVKVAALEKKVGNVKFTGDARLRYVGTETKPNGGVKTVATDNQLRVRLTADAAVNDKVSVVARFKIGDYSLKNDNGAANDVVDRFYVKYTDKVTVIAGKQDIFLGKGTIIDDALKGVVVAAPVGKYTATLAYGRTDLNADAADKTKNTVNPYDLTALQFDGVKLMDKLTLGFDVGSVKAKNANINGDSKELKVAAVNLDYAINDKLALYAEFAKADAKNTTSAQKNAMYIGLNAKNIVNKTNLNLSYAKLGGGFKALETVTTLTDQIGSIASDKTEVWRLKADYALMPNTTLYVDFSKADQKKTDGTKDKFDRIETGLEFKF